MAKTALLEKANRASPSSVSVPTQGAAAAACTGSTCPACAVSACEMALRGELRA